MVADKAGTDREGRINYERMRKYRLERAKEQLNKHGLGALITWDDSNMQYLTGIFQEVPFRYRQGQYVILTRNGNLYYCGAHLEGRVPWFKGKIYPAVVPSGLFQLQTKEECQDLARQIADIMDEHGVKNETIGLNGGLAESFVKEALNDIGINSIHDKQVMAGARRIKNQDEIECMRIACANSDEAFAAVRDAIRPNVTEHELVGVGADILYRLGADEVLPPICASGERTNPIQYTATNRQIKQGDLIIYGMIGNSFQGYKTCYFRVFCCGRATAEQKELYEEARAMLYAGLSAVKAGNTALDVVEKCEVRSRDWVDDEVLHLIGMDPFEGFVIGPPSIRATTTPKAKLAEVKLEENMTLAWMEVFGKPGGHDGLRVEENIAVSKDGYDLLTKFPVDEITECWI